MASPDFLYNIAIEGEKQVLVDWGNAPGWMKEYRELLDSAERISLIPKNGHKNLPVVTTSLSGDKRWIIFSRIFGKMPSDGRQIRVYAIGWQQTIKGINNKSIQWVYPTGAVENADEPTLINHFLR